MNIKRDIKSGRQARSAVFLRYIRMEHNKMLKYEIDFSILHKNILPILYKMSIYKIKHTIYN